MADEHQAFIDFYHQHYRLILTVAHQRLGSHTEAEDITAEVFRITWSYFETGNTPTLPWLYQVLRHRVGQEYRRTNRSHALTQKIGSHSHTRPFDDADLEVLNTREALRRLPPGPRELLRMAYWEDLTMKEIAEILGINVAAVKVRLFRARKLLKTQLHEVPVSEQAGEGAQSWMN